jgi:hypothetical protein
MVKPHFLPATAKDEPVNDDEENQPDAHSDQNAGSDESSCVHVCVKLPPKVGQLTMSPYWCQSEPTRAVQVEAPRRLRGS